MDIINRLFDYIMGIYQSIRRFLFLCSGFSMIPFLMLMRDLLFKYSFDLVKTFEHNGWFWFISLSIATASILVFYADLYLIEQTERSSASFGHQGVVTGLNWLGILMYGGIVGYFVFILKMDDVFSLWMGLFLLIMYLASAYLQNLIELNWLFWLLGYKVYYLENDLILLVRFFKPIDIGSVITVRQVGSTPFFILMKDDTEVVERMAIEDEVNYESIVRESFSKLRMMIVG